MKRFSFSLQKLLDLREFREKQAELALGKAVSARDAIQLELEEVGRKRVEATYSRQKGCSIQELLAIENYVNRLDKKKETLLEDLAAAELAVERARTEYLVASRDRQVLSKLREKKAAAWHKENLNEEAATLDDIANSRYGKDDLI
jgi:flagellar FliJ protein